MGLIHEGMSGMGLTTRADPLAAGLDTRSGWGRRGRWSGILHVHVHTRATLPLQHFLTPVLCLYIRCMTKDKLHDQFHQNNLKIEVLESPRATWCDILCCINLRMLR